MMSSKKTRQREAERLAKKKKRGKQLITAGICVLAVAVAALIILKVTEKQYIADIDIRDYGTITVELDSKSAPKTVKNFVELSESGFYDGLTFHRIMEGFMMQGGDPDGNGSGGSGKKIKGEFSANGVNNKLSHVRGTISMARATPYDSASSQFFIMQQDNTSLDDCTPRSAKLSPVWTLLTRSVMTLIRRTITEQSRRASSRLSIPLQLEQNNRNPLERFSSGCQTVDKVPLIERRSFIRGTLSTV